MSINKQRKDNHVLIGIVQLIEFRVLRKDRMKLYQHSVRCSTAMQIFLDANPQYWRFVPMTIEESERPEQRTVQRSAPSNRIDFNRRSEEDYRTYVESVPIPPTGYIFSQRQILLQMEYFHEKRDHSLPRQDIDLYHGTIVAVCK